MKNNTINSILLPVLIAGLNLISAARVTAQTFTTLHSFDISDGAYPYGGLILSSNTLYGTAYVGGSLGYGTVFALNPNGMGFTNLHIFTGGSDEGAPWAGLTVSGNTLYGTTLYGNGTVFKLNTDGSGFTNLHSFTGRSGPSFTNSDGADPQAGLILSGNTLFGTANIGGNSGNGTVFKVNTNGTSFTILHSFTATPPYPNTTNSDGADPDAGLILSGNILYGTASGGGTSGNGTVFKVNTNGTGFTTLHSFTAGASDPSNGYTNSDGASPDAGLILSGNTLFGTTRSEGSSGQGTVFKVNTDGTGFTTLHSFTAVDPIAQTNSDGAFLRAGLALSGNTLYGTALLGGSSGLGTMFAVNTDGTGFTNLHSFTGGSDGDQPIGGLMLSGNTLYGTASSGGSLGYGAVFSLSFQPQLTITSSETNVILSWPTNVAGFDYTGYTLQSAPALTGTFTNLPAATNPYTNPITGPQQFFRLMQ
jgi:uncharacterized repeat protein (TIGR03803 family)